MQVSAQFALAIVVVNLAPLKQKVPDAEIEYAGPALRARFLLLRGGRLVWPLLSAKIRTTGCSMRTSFTYQALRSREVTVIPKMKCVGLQQRRIWIRCRSMDDDAIEIDHGTDTRPVNREILDLDLAAEGFTRLLLGSPEEVRVKAFTV